MDAVEVIDVAIDLLIQQSLSV